LPIDAPNLSALLGKAVLTEKKAREILTGNYRRCNIVAPCLMAQRSLLRQYISAGSVIPSLVFTQQLFTSPAHSAHFSFFLSQTGYMGAVLWTVEPDTRDLDLKLSNEKETLQEIRRVLPIRYDIAYLFCFTGAETEIHKINDDSKIKRQTNLDRRGPMPIPIICHLLDPPWPLVLVTDYL
jgi:hypothetical protein